MFGKEFLKEIEENAKKLHKQVIFADSYDLRSIKAAKYLVDNKIAQSILIGDKNQIAKVTKDAGVDLRGIEIIEIENNPLLDEFTQILYERRKEKGWTPEQTLAAVKTPLYFAGMLLDTGRTDVVIAGNVSATPDVLRASIHTVGVAEGISLVSSYFLMVFPDKIYGFADCAVNPNPTSEQLADIAISTARNFQSVTGIEPKVGMLSFSTNGSADHPDVDKVKLATKIVKEKAPDIECDGEMQFDAAIVPVIGQRKFPGSKIAGYVNTMIFPDLDAGNIGYKIAQRLGGAEAIGPIMQGLKKPYCDLSRGASVEDMVSVAEINLLMA